MQVKEDVPAKVKDAGGTDSAGNGSSAVSINLLAPAQASRVVRRSEAKVMQTELVKSVLLVMSIQIHARIETYA